MKSLVFVMVLALGGCVLVSGQTGGAGMDPTTMYLMMQIMSDPNLMSMPLASMVMQNPSMMQNPMNAYLLSLMLGIDVNKIAAPMAMANGLSGGMGLMRWLPLVMGDPNMMGLMFSLGGFGGNMAAMG